MRARHYKTQATPRGLGVTCPRADCGGRFIVNEAEWLAGKGDSAMTQDHVPFKCRPCPYCFRISALPGQKRPES